MAYEVCSTAEQTMATLVTKLTSCTKGRLFEVVEMRFNYGNETRKEWFAGAGKVTDSVQALIVPVQ